jgi:hypothetical protein
VDVIVEFVTDNKGSGSGSQHWLAVFLEDDDGDEEEK